MEWFKFTTNICEVLHKTTLLLALGNEKWFFRTLKMKTSFDKLVSHSNMHPFAQNEIIWENYPSKLALTSVIWLESHEPSYSITHYEKTFFKIFALFQVCWFLWLLGHKFGCNAKVLHFLIFFEFFKHRFQNAVKTGEGAWPVVARGGILQKIW